MTTPVLSLTGRLLCAAQQAYEIQVTGPAPASPPTPTPRPSDLVLWYGVPQCEAVDDGPRGINAGLVGRTVNNETIVAFRGTEPFNSLDHERMVLDWIQNFLLIPLGPSPDVVGSVHQGFSHAVDGLWDWLLQQLGPPNPARPLYVTGHSKGGAMANIAAVKLAVHGYTPLVCTFEAARAGDVDFAADFNAKVVNATRWEFQNDIVPLLPPTDALLQYVKQLSFLTWLASAAIPSYVPVGDLRFIDWQNNVVGDTPKLQAQRAAHLMEELDKLNCGQVIDDHSIAPGSGAAAVICGAIWPPAPSTVPVAAAASAIGAGAAAGLLR